MINVGNIAEAIARLGSLQLDELNAARDKIIAGLVNVCLLPPESPPVLHYEAIGRAKLFCMLAIEHSARAKKLPTRFRGSSLDGLGVDDQMPLIKKLLDEAHEPVGESDPSADRLLHLGGEA